MPRHQVDFIVVILAVMISVQESVGEMESDRSDLPPTYKQIKIAAMLLEWDF